MSWMEVKTYFHQQFSKSIVRILKKMQHESATFAQELSILIVAYKFVFFCKKAIFFCRSLNFLNIMLEISLRFS